jgi:hypothetical protein
MLKRKDCTPVVSRKLVKNIKVKTVYGTWEIPMIPCKAHQHLKPINSQYIESASKRKFEEQLRSQCADCWDIYNGRHPNKYTSPTNDLTAFIMEFEDV